jgi:hypothetical protein
MTDTNATTNEAYENGHASPGGPEHLGAIFGGLAAAGARFGVTLGKIALQHSAKTLETTASFLGVLAEKLGEASEKVTAKADGEEKAS